MGELEEHPLAAIFPLMEEVELGGLAEDIAANGQQEPVWLFEDRILDGRNRYRACVGRGLTPLLAEYTGDDPAGFVISKNLHRRHLTESQRAMVGGKIAANLQQKGRTVRAAVEKAARMVNVGERSVYSAMGVVSGGVPELAAAVETGEATVSAAAEVAKLPKAEQKMVVRKKKVKEKAAEKRKQKEVKGNAAEKRKQEKEQAGAGGPETAADTTPTEAAAAGQPADPAAEFVGRVNRLCHGIDELKAAASGLAKTAVFGRHIHAESITASLQAARSALWQSRPTEPCNCVADGKDAGPTCKACFGAGRCPPSRVLKKGGR